MTKSTLLLSLLLFFISCDKNPDCKAPEKTSAEQQDSCTQVDPTSDSTPVSTPAPVPAPVPAPGETSDVPFEASLFEARIDFYKFDGADEAKLQKAIAIIKKVIASSEFRSRVLNFSYNGKKQFVDNGGKTNAEIYQILLNGQEELSPDLDHEMDLELELYYSSKNVVGYTTPSELRIYMNTKYFDVYTPAEVSGNVFHEWTHKLGFDHAFEYTVSRDSSVPYALGYLIEELGKKYE